MISHKVSLKRNRLTGHDCAISGFVEKVPLAVAFVQYVFVVEALPARRGDGLTSVPRPQLNGRSMHFRGNIFHIFLLRVF